MVNVYEMINERPIESACYLLSLGGRAPDFEVTRMIQ